MPVVDTHLQSLAPAVAELLARHGVEPVLIDIGASGPLRDIWRLVAPASVLVRFDPDLRDIVELDGTGYRRAVTVNEAVTAQPNVAEVPFFLTRSPYCSSTLEPDIDALSDYIYADLFRVERRVSVKAATLDSVLQRLSIDRLDWFKTDSQGTDLRLFTSLAQKVRDRVLCVEVEPGILDAYKGEDHFIDAQRELKRQGFWLADGKVCGTTRIRQSSMARLRSADAAVDAYEIGQKCAVSPGWVEALYLRDLRQLEQRNAPQGDYVVLWAFALMVRQWGFALDVALDCERRFGADATSAAMTAPVMAMLLRRDRRLIKQARRAVKALVPSAVVTWLQARGL